MKRGLPAARATASSSPGPGWRPVASATMVVTAEWSSAGTLSCHAPASRSADSTRVSSPLRGTGRAQTTKVSGRSAGSRINAASASRLGVSAHCRSSRPSSSGSSSASSSMKSVNASTTRNCRPGSLLTVIGAWLAPSRGASRPAIVARRESPDPGSQPSARASRPNGRLCSSSSARPSATCMPRRRASSHTSASSRLLPIPASPSRTTVAVRWAAAASSARPRSAVSSWRPSRRVRPAMAQTLLPGVISRPGPDDADLRTSIVQDSGRGDQRAYGSFQPLRY
jgi:hypothetical protein